MSVSERGQALPIAAFFVCAMCLVAVLVVYVGSAVNTNAKLRTAADASALAAAQGGREAAETAASANGAELVSVRTEGADSVAEVKMGEQQLEARARLVGGLPAE